MTSIHKTVLLNETIDGLLGLEKAGNENLVVLDGTYGGGGHSREVCKRFPGTRIIALDQDSNVLPNVDVDCNITIHNENFRNMDKVLKKVLEKEEEKVDGIILDLGLSSDQLESSGRGFSFVKDEPLLMNLKSTKENPSPEDGELTARDIVNDWQEESLEQIIYGYGEEKFAKRIARGIVEAREDREIKTTFDLVKIIERSVPAVYRKGRLHFATRTFQAIRIAVNDELGALKEGLEKGFGVLNKGGRMAVISFHSLEDRIVKRFYKEREKEGTAILITKKPIIATKEEIKNNPRSRSAKLRILEKI